MIEAKEIANRMFEKEFHPLKFKQYFIDAINEAVAAEREACATLLESIHGDNGDVAAYRHFMAELIRARGEQ